MPVLMTEGQHDNDRTSQMSNVLGVSTDIEWCETHMEMLHRSIAHNQEVVIIVSYV